MKGRRAQCTVEMMGGIANKRHHVESNKSLMRTYQTSQTSAVSLRDESAEDNNE